ncbi:MAG: endo alpha-1,4 polygalactosaminidase [Bacteroidota bacterium]
MPDRESRRAKLAEAEAFLPVLSAVMDVDALAKTPVAILDPDPYTADDIARLRDEGVLTLGYLNIGEAETFRRFYEDVDPTWILGDNPMWEGHQFVDARNQGWQRLIVDRVASAILSKEFDGLFLDMADVAAPGVHPETRDGIERLILRLRAAYPMHLLVMNRGLFLVEDVEAAIDGLAVEGVFARHDLQTGIYSQTPQDQRSALVAALNGFRERTGGAALVIDYADSEALRQHAEAEAELEGLPVYIGTIELAGRGMTP